MRHLLSIFLLALTVMMLSAASAAPVEINSSPALKPAVVNDIDVSLRLIGGRGAVMMPGRDINLTFQTSSDAYVIIYNIDSEGYVHLLYPADGRPEMVQGKKVYFLPEQGAGVTWEVGRDTGIEYMHAIAVSDPSRIDRDELYYLAQNSSMPEERKLRIDMDPFLAFNMIDEELIEDAERMTPATDYTYFYINRKVDYPGYLCYKCHSPSKIPDPYAMECPEVDIEMIAVNEDASYPYPQLFAVLEAGSEAPGDEYSSYTYYDDNLSLGYDDYDYDDQNVYLSIYNTYGYYPYTCYWPGYWSWYVNWNPYWYWDISWGIGWGWSTGCYYYHYPFYSWYPYSYSSYWRGYHHGYWDGYYYGGGNYPGHYYPANKRSLYAGRGFTKRGALDYNSTRVKTATAAGTRDATRRASLDYTSTRVKTSREATLASSRLVKQRTAAATARSYQRSRLAKQVTRERASTGFRSFETSRYETGRTSRYNRGTYGNYGATRSARTVNQDTRKTRERTTSGNGTLRSDKGVRSYDRGSSRTTTQRGTERQNTGSQLEKRVRTRNSAKETKSGDTRKARSYTPNRSSARPGTSARTTKESGKSNSGSTDRSRTSGSQSRDSSVRKDSGSSGSSGSNTTRSAPTRSSGSRSSGSRSSGKSSSGSRSSGRRR